MTCLIANGARPERLADDLLSGCDAIAGYLGESRRRTYYLLESGDLPGFKLRGRWYARKSTLRARLDALERGETA